MRRTDDLCRSGNLSGVRRGVSGDASGSVRALKEHIAQLSSGRAHFGVAAEAGVDHALEAGRQIGNRFEGSAARREVLDDLGSAHLS